MYPFFRLIFDVCDFQYYGEKTKKFFTGKTAFSKICFFNTFLVVSEMIFYIHSTGQKTSWRPIKCSLRFGSLDNLRKYRANTFVHWKIAFFFEICVFNNILVLKKWSCDFNSNCQNTAWTLIGRPLRFVTVDKRRKKGQNFFFAGKVAFSSEKCVFNNLLGPENRPYYFHISC